MKEIQNLYRVLPFKITDFWLQANQAENKWKKNSLKYLTLHMGLYWITNNQTCLFIFFKDSFRVHC